MGEFTLAQPAMVCRWRLSNRRLPLQNRHFRALAQRRPNDSKLSPALIAWVKQRVEWTLEDGAAKYPDGVLMLVVDIEGKAAMSVGAYRPLEHTALNDLLARAVLSRREGQKLGVSPEDLWLVRNDTLVWGKDPDSAPCGTCTLIDQLARTMGMPVQRDEDLLDYVARHGIVNEEAFLVSDEHGVVPASDHNGIRSKKFAASYVKLLSSKRTR